MGKSEIPLACRVPVWQKFAQVSYCVPRPTPRERLAHQALCVHALARAYSWRDRADAWVHRWPHAVLPLPPRAALLALACPALPPEPPDTPGSPPCHPCRHGTPTAGSSSPCTGVGRPSPCPAQPRAVRGQDIDRRYPSLPPPPCRAPGCLRARGVPPLARRAPGG